jgi:FAD:protein FMN transferase
VAAYGNDVDFLAETVNEVFEEVDRLDAQMSNYKPESELSHINQEAAHADVVVEPRLCGLIQLCLRLSEDTGGAFEITVGPLIKAWGFFRGQGRVPSPQEIHDVLKHVGYGTFIWMRRGTPPTSARRGSSWTLGPKRRVMLWTAP